MPRNLSPARHARPGLQCGMVHTVAGHGLGGGGHPDATTAWSGKDPGGMAVGCPVLSEQGEGAERQGDRAVLGACAATHMDEHAGAVDSGDLEVGALWQSEPTGVDGGQAGPIAQQLKGCQHGAHCFDTEDHGECLLPWGTHQGQRGPCPLAGVFGEERDTAQRDGAGAA